MKAKDKQTRERGLAVVRTVAELRKAVASFRAAGRTVGLRQRVWPMVEMLKRALAEQQPVVWGV